MINYGAAATIAAEPVGPPDGNAADHLTVVADLARTVEQQCPVEQAFDACLRTICATGPWAGAHADLSNGGSWAPNLPQISIWYPAGFDESVRRRSQSSRPLAVRRFPIRLGADVAAVVDLYAEESVELDPQTCRVITMACALVGRVIERRRAAADRDSAEADRAHQWGLLKESEEVLREQYARVYTALNNMNHGLAMYDGAGKMVICNDLYATTYGLTSGDVRPGTSIEKIAERRRAKGVDIADGIEDGAFETRGTLALQNVNRTFRLADGRRIVVSVQPLWDGGWVTTHEDTTERRRFEERISHLAHHDALTDLANRVLFREHLDQALAQACRGGDGIAVLGLDLDRFKAINDTMGHIVGDQVLKQVAKRLRDCVRETDLVARIGGDEFAILQVPARQRSDAAALARRVRGVIAAPLEVEGQSIMLDTSIGICLAPADTNDADELLRNADIALYRAKSEGRRTHRFFKPGMDAAVRARRQLEADLRGAIEAGDFELHYQPIIDLKTGVIVSCEALLRWHHRVRGSISPGDFIPIAEEAGLMVELGAWVLGRACADAAAWPNDVAVAVNISPSHVISRQFISGVLRTLEASGLSSKRLEIEITEAVLMQHTDIALHVIGKLRAMGVQLAMDDFGTGYSSLNYLRRFPFTKIKIDRSFIAGLPEEKNTYAIVKAITALSDGMGVITTAEGVETEAQLAAVRALGCTQMQGFLFSKPVRNDELLRLFAARLCPDAAA